MPELTVYLAFFACFFVWPFTARFGRRWSIALASLIFCIGGIVQVLNTHSLAAFYVARVVSGVGVGSKQLFNLNTVAHIESLLWYYANHTQCNSGNCHYPNVFG